MIYTEIANKILNSNKIAITFHASPDGDAIGSGLGLLNGLRILGKDIYIISKEEVPKNLSFLSCAEEITGELVEPTKDTDLLILVDCGDKPRICADISNYSGDIIIIDHHLSNEKFGNINLVEPDAAATTELIYLLLKEMKLDFSKSSVSEKVGTCIYTGLVTDTGCFRHSNVTKRTHDIAGELVGFGVSNTYIYNNLFDNKPFNKVKLMGYALKDIELLAKGKVTYIGLPMKMLEELNLGNVDTSEIISMALGVENIEAAVVLKEVEDGVKASLRSKNNLDVRKIAEKFGGGGHMKAAGLKMMNVDLKTAKEKIITEFEKELNV